MSYDDIPCVLSSDLEAASRLLDRIVFFNKPSSMDHVQPNLRPPITSVAGDYIRSRVHSFSSDSSSSIQIII